MDGRGRLAQPLKPKIKQRNAAARLSQSHAWHAQSWPVSSSGWRRLAWRWWAALLDFKAPRGAGASAAALLLLASASYGAVKGNHVPVIVGQLQDICDAAANSAGFGISEIALAGQHDVAREDILTLAGITGRSSLLFLDAAHMRARLLTNPWIAEATVLKLYPGRLRIEITERKPFALWQKDGRVALIASDGMVLESSVPRRFASLPRVVGQGAEKAAADFLELLARHPGIARLVEASVLVAERRWNLHLQGGVEVLLPESDPARALTTLADLARDRQLLTRDIVAVDLRLNDRVTVRQSNGAASVRDEALKAAADKDKKKRKGSDA
ncbi:MAG: FtsQ-type POTRA domain-containing protein [Rhizobiales bacterium]|nr:FtsQ-type POTRA domain-containing protein [Hyphomicrobiales bacterium]